MADYEQMEIDIRLESEKSLKDNVAMVIQFAYEQRIKEAEECGRTIPPVRNKHEGYGIAAEAFNKIQNAEKDIKNNMGTYLGMLQVKGDDAVQQCASLYEGVLNLSMAAINMAADMHRILNDLYYGIDRRTPIEKAIDDSTDDSTDDLGEKDGFEEVGSDELVEAREETEDE